MRASRLHTPAAIVFCALLMLSSGGCASVWQTPMPSTSASASPQAPTPEPGAAGSAPTAPSAAPSTPAANPASPSRLEPVTLTAVPVQTWTEANDIGGLLYLPPYLWAATHGGVVRWSVATGEYQQYTLADGLASHAVRGMALDADGHIWVGYADHGTWSEFDGATWRSHASREKAVETRYHALLNAQRFDVRLWSKRPGGTRLWLPTPDGRVQTYDGSRWRTFGEAEGVTRHTWMVAVSDAGRVWAVGQGLSTAEEGDRLWQDHSLFSGVSNESVAVDMAIDRQGGVWLAFAGGRRQSGGVSRLDGASGQWTIYSHALNPVIPGQVLRLEIAPDGTLWLAGEQGLVQRRPGGRWQAVQKLDLSAQCFERDEQGRFWIGSAQGLWMLHEGQLRGPWRIPSPLLSAEITDLAPSGQGRLLLGTPKGVSYIASSGDTDILTQDQALCLAADPKGQVWVGTRAGLYVVQGDGTLRRTLSEAVATLAFDAAGTPWLCTQDGRLGKLEGAGWQAVGNVAALAGEPVQDMAIGRDGSVWLATASGLIVAPAKGEFAPALMLDGPPHQDVRALAIEADGTLWAGTANGLGRRGPGGEWTQRTIATTDGGLRAMEIQDLFLDAGGTLWIATSAGISTRTKEAKWAYYDLPGVRALWADVTGTVWAGTLGGLTRVQAQAFTRIP